MPTVAELSDPYGNVLRNPLPYGSENVCSVCTTFTTQGFPTCYQCGQPGVQFADAVLPVSYSQNMAQYHHALSHYKPRSGRGGFRRFELDLAAILWRFLDRHERCLAEAVGVEEFDTVTTVPSSEPSRDAAHPLARIVGKVVKPTADRHRRLLRRTAEELGQFEVSGARYELLGDCDGADVLLIDDTWTTGTSVQSAAAALKAGGASAVGVVVLGRHVSPSPQNNHLERLKALPRAFDWTRCALCTGLG